MLFALVVLVLVFAILGVPRWPWSAGYGWGPSGGFLLLLVVLVCILTLGGGGGSVGANVTARGCGAHW